MALQLGALRAALIDAGAQPDKADKAAEEMAGYDGKISVIAADLTLVKWMLSFNLVVTVGILWRLMSH